MFVKKDARIDSYNGKNMIFSHEQELQGYKGVGCTRGWGVQGGGVYKGVGCTRGWGVQEGGVYKGVGCTRGWGVQGGGVYKGVGCTRGWGVQGGGVYPTITGDAMCRGDGTPFET